MVYFRRVVKRRPACLTDEEMSALLSAARKWEAHFRARDGADIPPVVPRTVLCMWCRLRHSPAEVDACMAMARPVPASANASTSSWIARMPPWLGPFPNLWEFLSKACYADGAPRQLGKVSLGLQSDGIQVTLTDPSSSTYCSRHYQSVEDALLGFEIGLGEGSLTWKASGPPKGRKSR